MYLKYEVCFYFGETTSIYLKIFYFSVYIHFDRKYFQSNALQISISIKT
jgi:hypothetical protein